MLAEVNPNMIVLAREARGLTQQDLAEKLNLHRANICRLERGETRVQEGTLLAISNATSYPPQFFSQRGSFISANLAYRKREHVPVRMLAPIEAQMNIIRHHVQLLTRGLDLPLPALPVFEVSDPQSPADIARLVRSNLELKAGAVENMVRLLESQGIVVSSFDFGTERVDSRSMLTDDRYPIIFVNKNLLGDRLRYSLAYELGQLTMHTFTQVAPDRDISREANQFASAFLMPEADIRPDFDNGINLPILAHLKSKWKVSMISLLYRADDLGYLTPNQKRYLIQQFNQARIRRREPLELDVPIEKPSLLRSYLHRYITQNNIGVGGMVEILAIPLEDYLDYYG